MQGVELIGIVDTSDKVSRSVAQQFGCQTFTDMQELRGLVDIVSIPTPAVAHAEAAVRLLEHGVHLYI
jgi:predicted dehydrogenase